MEFLANVQISYYVIPVFIILALVFALKNKTDAYESFITGSKDGIKTAFTILPYLLSMYVAVAVIDASGIFQDIIKFKNIPLEIILQGIFRPVSSNASLSFMINVFDIYGVDSKAGFVSSVMQGGTDTTVYVMTLYFGSIGVINYRYALKVGLLTDLFCFIMCVALYFTIT